MHKALKDKTELSDLVLTVYEKLCEHKTKKLVQSLDNVKYKQHNLEAPEYNSLEINSEDFIYEVSQYIIH